MRIRLDARSAATILAALRAFQEHDAFGAPLPDRIRNIATDDGKFERLDDDEIETLCERLLSSVQQS